jgi:hypothetical protein
MHAKIPPRSALSIFHTAWPTTHCHEGGGAVEQAVGLAAYFLCMDDAGVHTYDMMSSKEVSQEALQASEAIIVSSMGDDDGGPYPPVLLSTSNSESQPSPSP